MQEKVTEIDKNDTYDLMDLHKGKSALHNQWAFKLKKDCDKIVKYKTHLVVKGFQHKKIDFDEVFSLVVKMSSIHIVLG